MAGDPKEQPPADALTRWRRRTRAKLLTWMPLGAWKGLLGIVVLLTAGILRKVELIREPGFALLLSIGLALLGYQQVVNGKRSGKNGNSGGQDGPDRPGPTTPRPQNIPGQGGGGTPKKEGK